MTRAVNPLYRVKTCPACGRPSFRLQQSAPLGSREATGPVIAYPCGCWMPAEQGRAAAQATLRLVSS